MREIFRQPSLLEMTGLPEMQLTDLPIHAPPPGGGGEVHGQLQSCGLYARVVATAPTPDRPNDEIEMTFYFNTYHPRLPVSKGDNTEHFHCL